ncbi:penicillin-binding protein 1C [Spirochaetia bacterium]|nr:penicillin-binding protein 1C [Spirochaetia bacterium]GHU32726.1 penicillin-binding protein 1C [Spirochaetia bacterium]
MKKFIFFTIAIFFFFVLFVPVKLFDDPYSPVLYDRNGELLGALVAGDGQWRFPPGDSVNKKFAAALIEYEDKRFRYHKGVDPAAIARAFWLNIRAGHTVSGASTITMQVVRLSRAPKPRTLIEKIIEALLAIRIESTTSKEKILGLYADHAPFGANVVGLDAAAWRWFGRPPEELSWAEAATLAVLPNGPGLVHPGRNREILRTKRDALLDRLCKAGHFDRETLALAKLEDLPGVPELLPQLAPHLVARLSGVPDQKSRIQTTLDAKMQSRAQTIMNRWAARFAEQGINNAACLIMDTMTGAVRAYIGNVESVSAPDVDLVIARRSSGSLLKPFLYAAMLDSGDLLPSALVSDIPTRVGSYSPENNNRSYLGVVPADQALARSLNVPAVRELRVYGVDRFARLLRELGCTTLFRPGDDYGLPLILGGAEVTLWDMAGLYGGLARSAAGIAAPVFPPTVMNAPVAKKSRISAGAAWLTLEALTFVARPGEEAIWQNYADAQRIAWKTGTSFGNRDTWAVGVTPEWTVAVWVGNATGEGKADLKSNSTSAPVLFELFSAIRQNARTWFPEPSDYLAPVEVCAFSGFPAGIECEKVQTLMIPAAAPAHRVCPYCRTLIFNESGTAEITPQGGEPVTRQKWFILPPAEEWYYRAWNLDYRTPPAKTTVSALPFALYNPEEHAQIFVPVELDGRPGRVVFNAAHRDPDSLIYWHLDDTYLGSTATFHEMEARPRPGQHRLTLVDSIGNTLSRNFSVMERNGPEV